ncbi:hypothetical protein B0H21DRAFT_538153 [Amylocystis lapponica]|nr:hypothetical protein B0H21DRAFT_538153 [Amylocystis lapponica]
MSATDSGFGSSPKLGLGVRPQRKFHVTEQCAPLRYAHIPSVLKAAGSAFRDDPHLRYRFGALPRIVDPVALCSAIRRREAWTIDRGDAFVVFRPAPNSMPFLRRMVDTLVDSILGTLMFFLLPFSGREQKSHKQEARAKHEHAVETSFGRRIHDMFMIETLFVAPEKRGRGYGSRLLEFVIAKADAQARGTWVTTTPHGAGFYRLFGFRTVSRYTLGECDPAWKEPPVDQCIVSLFVCAGLVSWLAVANVRSCRVQMLREPRCVWETDEKARLV